MTRKTFVVDCETTSLTPDYAGNTGLIWELALVERRPVGGRTEFLYRMEPDLPKADPKSLTVNKYYESTRKMRHRDKRVHDLAATDLAARGGCWSDPAALAVVVARMLDGASLIAANPTFDANYLSAYLAAYGQSRQPWHYRLRDFGSMAWGWLNGYDYACQTEALAPEHGGRTRPFADRCPDLDASTDDFAKALGVDVGQFDRHSALGDCRLVCAGLDVIEGIQ